MQFEFTEDQRLLQQTVRDFLAGECPVAFVRGQWETPTGRSPEFWKKLAEIGVPGLLVPEAQGGLGMNEIDFVLVLVEIGRAALAEPVVPTAVVGVPLLREAAALGADAAKLADEWLPKIAAGEILVAIAVTEPDVGSDVASLQTRAEPAEHEGRRGWRINGAKAWSTFSGRADVLALLARTDPDVSKGNRGLSLFIVPKATFDGHQWRHEQPEGGVISGTANPTPGYRGMHSFTLAIEDYFVPHENLVGGDEGVGNGFFLQMGGFAAGRLQTGGRASGVAQAALEKACQYVSQRTQFGQALAEYQLTQHRIGMMASRIAAARQLTYSAARGFDTRGVEAPMAKLLACDVAVQATQDAQQLHGGWGYSEEDPIARYVVDALVLPIFEGVKPILELRVIGRALLAAAAS